jgi:hypothetical protein
VLWSTDVTAAADLDIEQAGVAHALEVRSHRVGVQIERHRDVGSGERAWRPGEFEVDRVARVVAERLEQVELAGSARELPAERRSSIVVIHIRRLHGIGR